MRRTGVISPDSQRKLKAKNWYFSQNAGDGSKIPSNFCGKLWVSSSPRIKASWPVGMKVVSRAITLTRSEKNSEKLCGFEIKGTVWIKGNLNCMLEKWASQWLSSRRSKSRRKSASEVSNIKNCCWYRSLAGDIGKVTVPETGISFWFAAQSRRWAGGNWFCSLTGSRFKSRWLMQDTLASVWQTAITGELQTSRYTKTFLLSMAELRIAGSFVKQWWSTAQPPHSCAGCFSLKVGTDCSNHAENVPRAHSWSRLNRLCSPDFYDCNVVFFSRSWCQNCWNSPDFGVVRFASIGCVNSTMCTISLVFVPFAALTLIREVVRLRFLRSAAGRTFTTTASLRGTALVIY